MNGQQLAHEYYLQYGAPMIEAKFGAVANRIAVGLVGHGSECFGYDDDVSHDHDFAPAFHLWLTDADYAEYGDALQEAYRHLPQEYAGVRLTHTGMDSQSYRGVMRIGDFYRPYIGDMQPPASWQQWLSIDSTYLAEATNGVVWRDDLGAFSAIRGGLMHYPADIRLKKLSAHLAMAAQYGQYNLARCVAHGEQGAAVLAIHGFVQHTLASIYLLADRYAPYYKWVMRGLDDFALGREVKPTINTLLTASHTADTLGQDAAMVEDICAIMVRTLREQDLSAAPNDYLEPHAYQVRRHIADPEVRALHIMAGI